MKNIFNQSITSASSPKTDPITTIEVVDPLAAAKLLKSNVNNRKLNRQSVRRYADIMIRGEWLFNGESIKVDSQKNLIDGQHRLEAVILSGASIKTSVVRGLDHATFKTIDTGRNRKATDVLSMKGEKNVKLLASAISVLHNSLVDFVDENKSHCRPTNTLTETLLMEHLTIREDVEWVMHSQFLKKFATNSVIAFCRYRIRYFKPGDGETFFELLDSGAGLNKDDPIFILRTRYMNLMADNKKPYKTSVAVALIYKTFRFWLNGKTCKLLATPIINNENRSDMFSL